MSTMNIIAALLIVALSIAAIATVPTAAAQSTNANPDNTTRINTWHFSYYYDHDNNPNTPPVRGDVQEFSRQDCEDRRDRMAAEGVPSGNGYVMPERIDKGCYLIKGVTQETEKFCYEYTWKSAPDQTNMDCWNTPQDCRVMRDQLIRNSNEYLATAPSDCGPRKQMT